MNFLKTFKNLLRRPRSVEKPTPPSSEAEPEEIAAPELTPREVQERLRSDAPPLLLDVREPYEWRQVRIPGALHIPMNSVPERLNTLPSDRPIVVFCAHGIRSFGVTYFLRQQGLEAYNLAGGITQWQMQGGEVENRSAL
ncbi:MAG: rhodanese-like domain-containing protein [Caldilinea sp.]|nr:rhodanese-like domain-containing protein [Caldilinea sp.]MDW8440151.1 rhodanese-like domain-containing protein [Caldilineaceae bacterium]